MDELTLEAYERAAAQYAQDWEEQPAPADMYALVDEFFCPGPTADVGCGSGRDAAWLSAHGFQTTGYDASPALLAEARRRHPDVDFAVARLPELEGVPRGHFANVLCETVIMHMRPTQITDSVRALLEMLAPEGTLYLSWRVAEEPGERRPDGRLYSAFSSELARAALADATILLDEEAMSASSDAMIHRLIARKR